MKTLSSILIIALGMLFLIPKKMPDETVVYYTESTVYFSEVRIQEKKDTITKVKVLLKHELDKIDYLVNFNKISKRLPK